MSQRSSQTESGTGRRDAYLSIVDWPAGMSRDQLAKVVAVASGLDPATCSLNLGNEPPRIFGVALGRAVAEQCAGALLGAGGDAFAFEIEDLETLGPTLKVKDLSITANGLQIELWRGDPVTVRPEQIDVVVRAQMRGRHELDKTEGRHHLGMPYDDASAPETVFGTALGFRGARIRARENFRHLEQMRDSHKRLVQAHKLDFHVRMDRSSVGQVYQIDGDKFAYAILGDLRGHSDHTNIDQMCDLLSHLNPKVVTDTFYPLWKAPPGHQRMKLPMMKLNNDEPAFAFYSRWCALLYRHLLDH